VLLVLVMLVLVLLELLVLVLLFQVPVVHVVIHVMVPRVPLCPVILEFLFLAPSLWAGSVPLDCSLGSEVLFHRWDLLTL
jgi:hypothetical protein